MDIRFNLEDFKEKNVLNIGYNHRNWSKKMVEDLKSKYVLCVDSDHDKITKSQNITRDYQNIEYLTDDFNNYTCFTNLNHFDVGVVWADTNLNINNVGSLIARLSTRVDILYIQCSWMTKTDLQKHILDYSTFTSIEYRTHKHRELFRCSKDVFSKDRLCQNIFNEIDNIQCSWMTKTDLQTDISNYRLPQLHEHGLYNPKTGNLNTRGKIITINGHGGVGKTTLKKYLITYIHENTKYKFDDFFSKPGHGLRNCKLVDNSKSICFIDDYGALEHPFMYTLQYDIIFIFDYRSFEYLKNIDIHKAFVINYDIQSRYKSRPAYCNNLSKDPISFINNIYHCEPLYKI